MKKELFNVSGDLVVFRSNLNEENEPPRFGAQFSRKDQNDQYDNAWMQIDFKKDARDSIKHGDYIRVKSGFITFFRNKDKNPVFKLMITEFETLGNMIEAKEKRKQSNEELPF